jgi:hypothetical protein
LNALDQNIIAFDITTSTLKIKKIVFSNDLTSGTTWQIIVMALLLKKKLNLSTDYNLDLSTTRTINGLSLAQT